MNLNYLKHGGLVDRVSKKNYKNQYVGKGALAQPLRLGESLKIRDGLGELEVNPVQLYQARAVPFPVLDSGYYWVCQN